MPQPKVKLTLHAEAFVDRILLVVTIFVLACTFAQHADAQDDATTQNGSSAVDGGWITGPASNPLSFLNGPAYRTFGSNLPYDFPDVRPVWELDKPLPRWMNFEAEERFRYEGYRNGSFREGNDDSYLLNRFRFQLDLQVASWVKLVFQTQDARPFFQKPPIGPPNENRWDLKLAYIEFGAPQRNWISVRVGRQLINYNNTIIANSEWRNQARSYDAVVVNLQKDRYHLGIFAASAVVPLASGISHHQEGNNIYGLYGRIENLVPHSSLEPFVLWRVQPSMTIDPGASTATGKENMKVYGIRLKGRDEVSLDYSSQMVLETGNDGPAPIHAWATSDGIAYQFRSRWPHPRVFAQYDFASGNNTPSAGMHRTFDTIYPTAHDRFGILDLFGWQNIETIRGGATIMPHRRWTATAQYLDSWVDSANDAVYNTSGGAIVFGKSADGRHLGQEADAYTWYELNRHVNIGAGYGYFAAGGYLAHAATGQLYSSPYFVINFKDSGKHESR